MKQWLLVVMCGCVVLLLSAPSPGATHPKCGFAVRGACCVGGGCLGGEITTCLCQWAPYPTCGCNADEGRNDFLANQNISRRSECSKVSPTGSLHCCSVESVSWFCRTRKDCVPWYESWCNFYGSGCDPASGGTFPHYNTCKGENPRDACECHRITHMSTVECFGADDLCEHRGEG